jgi:hypothetical protein
VTFYCLRKDADLGREDIEKAIGDYARIDFKFR